MGTVDDPGLWVESRLRLIVNKYQCSEVTSVHICTHLEVGAAEAAMILRSSLKLSYDKTAAVRGILSQISLAVQSTVVFVKDVD